MIALPVTLPRLRPILAALNEKQRREDIAQARRSRRSVVVREQAADRALRDKLLDDLEQKQALALIVGGEADTGDLSARLDTLSKRLPAYSAAVSLLDKEVSTLEADVAIAQEALSAPVLDLLATVQEAAVVELRKKLTDIAGALANLSAADRIRAHYLGNDFPVPAGSVAPFYIDVADIATRFTKALPKRLQIETLTANAVKAEGQIRASSLFAKIKEEN